MPRESFEELLTPADDDSPSSEACAAASFGPCDETVYDGKNMEAICEMLSFLNARLDVVSDVIAQLMYLLIRVFFTAAGSVNEYQ